MKKKRDGDGFVDDGLPTMRPVIPGFDLALTDLKVPGDGKGPGGPNHPDMKKKVKATKLATPEKQLSVRDAAKGAPGQKVAARVGQQSKMKSLDKGSWVDVEYKNDEYGWVTTVRPNGKKRRDAIKWKNFDAVADAGHGQDTKPGDGDNTPEWMEGVAEGAPKPAPPKGPDSADVSKPGGLTYDVAAEVGFSDWDTTKPWAATLEQVEAGEFPWIVHNPDMTDWIAARWHNGKMEVPTKFFDGDANELLVKHEVGHSVQKALFADLGDVGPLLEAFKNGNGYRSPFGGSDMPSEHGNQPAEIAADAFALLAHNQAGHYNAPGTDELFEAVAAKAKEMGFDLPDRDSKHKVHDNWAESGIGGWVRSPGQGRQVRVKADTEDSYGWTSFHMNADGTESLKSGTAKTVEEAQQAADAALAAQELADINEPGDVDAPGDIDLPDAPDVDLEDGEPDFDGGSPPPDIEALDALEDVAYEENTAAAWQRVADGWNAYAAAQESDTAKADQGKANAAAAQAEADKLSAGAPEGPTTPDTPDDTPEAPEPPQQAPDAPGQVNATLNLPDPMNGDAGAAGLTKTGGQGGSNPGGKFKVTDPDLLGGLEAGDEMYVKRARTPDHVRHETAANLFYEMAGVPVPDVHLNDDASVIGSKIVDGDDIQSLAKGLKNPEVAAQIREGFVVDAWLANWDTVGLELDNMIVADGVPYRIDAGGALGYRAMGKPKGDAFGPEVGELSTLRDKGMNAQSAKVFGSVTDDELRAGAEKVAGISPDQIRATVDELDMDPEVADTLIERRQNIINELLDGVDPLDGVDVDAPDGPEPGDLEAAKADPDMAEVAEHLQVFAKPEPPGGLFAEEIDLEALTPDELEERLKALDELITAHYAVASSKWAEKNGMTAGHMDMVDKYEEGRVLTLSVLDEKNSVETEFPDDPIVSDIEALASAHPELVASAIATEWMAPTDEQILAEIKAGEFDFQEHLVYESQNKKILETVTAKINAGLAPEQPGSTDATPDVPSAPGDAPNVPAPTVADATPEWIAGQALEAPGQKVTARVSAGSKLKNFPPGTMVDVEYKNDEYGWVTTVRPNGKKRRDAVKWSNFDGYTVDEYGTTAAPSAPPGAPQNAADAPKGPSAPNPKAQAEKAAAKADAAASKMPASNPAAAKDKAKAVRSVGDEYQKLAAQYPDDAATYQSLADAKYAEADALEGMADDLAATVEGGTGQFAAMPDDDLAGKVVTLVQKLPDGPFVKASRTSQSQLGLFPKDREAASLKVDILAAQINQMTVAGAPEEDIELLREMRKRVIDIRDSAAAAPMPSTAAGAEKTPFMRQIQQALTGISKTKKGDGLKGSEVHKNLLRKQRDYYMSLGQAYDADNKFAEAKKARELGAEVQAQLEKLQKGHPDWKLDSGWIQFAGYTEGPKLEWKPGRPIPEVGDTDNWKKYRRHVDKRVKKTPKDPKVLREQADAFDAEAAHAGTDTPAGKKAADRAAALRADADKFEAEAIEAAKKAEAERIAKKKKADAARKKARAEAAKNDPWGPPPERLALYNEMLEEVDRDGRAGSSFAYDGDKVEGFSMRVRRRKYAFADGEEPTDAMQLQFKVTSKGGDEVEAFMADGKPLGKIVLQKEIDGVVQRQADGFETDASGAQTRVKELVLNDGTRVEVRHHWADIKSSTSPYALINQVQVLAEGELTQKQVDELFSKMGIPSGYPDDKAVDKYKRAVLEDLFRDGKKTGIKVAQEEYGITPDDVVLENIEGRVVPVISEEAAAKIAKATNTGGFIQTSTGGGKTVDQWVEVLASGQGLLSTMARYTEGIGKGGMSSSADITSGGADYVFTRQASPGSSHGGGSGVVVDAAKVLRRLDWFAYKSDRYGTRRGKRENWLQNLKSKGGSRETMFRRSIPVSQWWQAVIGNQSDRDAVIAKLKARGITHINGRPIEEFVVAQGKVPPIPTVPSPDPGDPPSLLNVPPPILQAGGAAAGGAAGAAGGAAGGGGAV